MKHLRFNSETDQKNGEKALMICIIQAPKLRIEQQDKTCKKDW